MVLLSPGERRTSVAPWDSLACSFSASLGRSNLSEINVRPRPVGKELLHIMPTPFVAGTGAPELSADELDLEFDEAPEFEAGEAEPEPTFAELGASQGVIAALA